MPPRGKREGEGLFTTETPGKSPCRAPMLSSGAKSCSCPRDGPPPLAFLHSDGKGAGTIGHAGWRHLRPHRGPTTHRRSPQPEGCRRPDQDHATWRPANPTATFNRTNRATVSGTVAYLHNGSHLVALDLSKPEAEREVWRAAKPTPAELIVAGDHLVLGLAGSIEILDTLDGKTLSTHEVDGVAHGLSVADGRLLVSTNRGTLHAFAP